MAKAYGAISDIDRQAHVYAELQDAWYQITPDTIRRMVLDATVRGSDPRAVLVGRDAYLAAGGRIERELFDDDARESWIDVALLEDLAHKEDRTSGVLGKSVSVGVVPGGARHFKKKTT